MKLAKRIKTQSTGWITLLLLAFIIFCLLITSFLPQPVNAQTITRDTEVIAFTQAMVKQSIEDTLNQLQATYVYPDNVPAIRDALISRYEKGDYAAIATNVDFAKTVSEELRRISGDGHLSVQINKPGGGPLTPVLPPQTEQVRNNFAFQQVEILAGNIGLLKFNKFDANPNTQLVADHAMGFLSRSDALIIDLRDCIGGSPQLVRYLISHFIEQKTELWTAVDRGEEQTPINTLTNIGPARLKHDFPIFILTGPRTTSAAEVFAFIMQQTGKATVVGEQTRGITHQVSAYPINDYFYGRFSSHWLRFPFAQQGFEGQGVTPDIAVPLANSLDTAHAQALEILAN